MRIKKEIFLSQDAREILGENKLGDFRSLWELEAQWFEKPNEARGGQSGVVTFQLSNRSGKSRRVFIKRQQSHNTRSLKHPICGIPTFYREYLGIEALRALGVPAIDLLYFGRADIDGQDCSILVSYALDGYLCLDDWFEQFRSQMTEKQIRHLLDVVIAALLPIHENSFRHGSLYGKHIFVLASEDDDYRACKIPVVESGFDIRLLDFEKTHSVLMKNRAIIKDLSQFLRRCYFLEEAEREYLLDTYFRQSNLDQAGVRKIRSGLEKDMIKKDRQS